MKILGYTLFSIAALVALVFILWRPSGHRDAKPIENLPWQIERLPSGDTKVFGLTLTKSTFEDARRRFGPDLDLAVIAAPGETGSLEGYYGDFTAGVMAGKLVLAAAIDKPTVERLRARAVKSDYMQSATRRYTLTPDDRAFAEQTAIATITFVPSASIDAENVTRLFGAPAERLRVDENTEHLLFPEKGLDVTLNTKGKDVLQYVAPRDFARLRDPVLKASRANAGKKPAGADS
jgi:hypothetical protein